jgi:type IV pilus assembly protein PilA
MFCPRCGTANTDQTKYCVGCGDALPAGSSASPAPGAGDPIASAPTAVAASDVPTSGKAIASLVCGIVGFVFLGSIAAVILGHMALSEIRKSAGRLGGAGIATAGLVLGYIGIAIIPVILIIAAIAIPNLLRARIAANEASAVGTLRSIDIGALTYATEFQNGFPASFEVLGGAGGSVTCDHAQMLDDTLVRTHQKSGYIFTYTPKLADDSPLPAVSAAAQAKGCSSGGVPAYEVTAEPAQQESSGRRRFFTDQTGVIRYSIHGVATADSPPLQ